MELEHETQGVALRIGDSGLGLVPSVGWVSLRESIRPLTPCL